MPDLIGKRLEQTSKQIRSEGFQLGKLNYRKQAGVGPGLIVQQQPQAGHRMLKGDPITLEVSQ
jgi:beta-lactam-binding protein with PASTA domain